jgi:hypothetical protein
MTKPIQPESVEVTQADRYLIVKRGLYFRPADHGYTGLKREAGRYPASHACALSGETAVHEDEAAEYSPACWEETKLADKDRQIAELRDGLNTRIASTTPTDEADFQSGVDLWMDACFGEPIKSDQLERADRFTEEALELVQTMPGFTAERAHALVDYVFGRPVGERGQEVGGVMVCLAALCNTVGLSVNAEADRELARIWTKVEAIRAKQKAKPTGSALPIALSTPTDATAVEDEREAKS